MRILLLGHRGQVGWELRRALAPLGEVIALGRESSEGLCGDLGQPDELRRTVQCLEPQAIVNAAAYTDVDRAEADAERAERINAFAPGVLAAEAARIGAWLVHYSSDYVFDGSGSEPWSEDDSPAPLNVYGSTKRRGEQAIIEAECRHLIFRTQWVFSTRGRNFVQQILQLACERDGLEIIDDQIGAPTSAELVADVTAHALKLAFGGAETPGIFHLAARGEVSWHAYACFVIAEARRHGWPVRVNDAAIVPVATDALPMSARRPRNSRLCVDRLEQTFGVYLPQWPAGVARAVEELGRVMPEGAMS